jgi:hypothetical protein
MSNETPTPNNEKQIIVNVEDKSPAKWILDGVVGVGALAQVVIGFILIWQLQAYEASNDLTRQSLELTRKVTAIQHTPWLGIGQPMALTPTQDNKTLIMVFEARNSSDAPILWMKGNCESVPQNSIPDAPEILLKHATDYQQCIMPSDKMPLRCNLATTDAARLKDEIEKGEQTVRIVLSYGDVFSDRIVIAEDFEIDPVTNTWAIVKTSITGFQSY